MATGFQYPIVHRLPISPASVLFKSSKWRSEIMGKTLAIMIYRFVDQEVLQFLTHISGCIIANKIITISLRTGKLNAKHCAVVDQLLRIFRKESSKIYLEYYGSMASIPYPLPEMELQICMFLYNEEVDIPILMKMLASPRADGRQWVFCLASTDVVAIKVVDAMKQVDLQKIRLTILSLFVRSGKWVKKLSIFTTYFLNNFSLIHRIFVPPHNGCHNHFTSVSV
jgi:hypothetical protein